MPRYLQEGVHGHWFGWIGPGAPCLPAWLALGPAGRTLGRLGWIGGGGPAAWADGWLSGLAVSWLARRTASHEVHPKIGSANWAAGGSDPILWNA